MLFEFVRPVRIIRPIFGTAIPELVGKTWFVIGIRRHSVPFPRALDAGSRASLSQGRVRVRVNIQIPNRGVPLGLAFWRSRVRVRVIFQNTNPYKRVDLFAIVSAVRTLVSREN